MERLSGSNSGAVVTTVDGAVEEDELPDPDDGPSMLDVLEGMATHFHEHHDALVAWPWKLFCAKWVRLITVSTHDWEERQEREAKQEAEEQRQRLEAFRGGY